jgi:hypothetical protein
MYVYTRNFKFLVCVYTYMKIHIHIHGNVYTCARLISVLITEYSMAIGDFASISWSDRTVFVISKRTAIVYFILCSAYCVAGAMFCSVFSVHTRTESSENIIPSLISGPLVACESYEMGFYVVLFHCCE